MSSVKFIKYSCLALVLCSVFITDLPTPNVTIEPPECFELGQEDSKIQFDTKFIHFYLYTRENELVEVPFNFTPDELKKTDYSANKKTYFLIHGFWSDGLGYGEEIAPELLTKEDSNVFAVDWGVLAAAPCYFIASENSLKVGEFVGDFTTKLADETGLDAKNIHVIGHSLGAHAAGHLGRQHFGNTGEKISRITGLDPARPYFEILPKEIRLNRYDADFVDVIHVNSGSLVIVSKHLRICRVGSFSITSSNVPGMSIFLHGDGTCGLLPSRGSSSARLY